MSDITTRCGVAFTTICGREVTSICGRPVASGGSGPVIGDVPAPTHYWAFQSSPFPDPNTSNTWDGVGGTLGLEASAGGISGNGANYDETNQLLNYTGITTPTDRLIVSGWLRDGVGASLLDLLVDLDGGSNFASLRSDPSNATVWDGSTWHHVMLDWHGYDFSIYLDGALYFHDDAYALWPDASASLCISAGTGTGMVDNVYVWADPSMGALTGAQMAVLLRNGGAGVDWNGTTWTEL